jgi:hypothetical protein
MIENWWYFTRFIGLTALIGGYLFIVFGRVIREALTPNDVYTKLRWRIFYGLLLIAFISIPSVVYTGLLSIGQEYQNFRNIVNITSTIKDYVVFVVIVSILFYTVKAKR